MRTPEPPPEPPGPKTATTDGLTLSMTATRRASSSATRGSSSPRLIEPAAAIARVQMAVGMKAFQNSRRTMRSSSMTVAPALLFMGVAPFARLFRAGPFQHRDHVARGAVGLVRVEAANQLPPFAAQLVEELLVLLFVEVAADPEAGGGELEDFVLPAHGYPRKLVRFTCSTGRCPGPLPSRRGRRRPCPRRSRRCAAGARRRR